MLERDELDDLLSSVYNEKITAPPQLILETTRKLQRAKGIHYALGLCIASNILTFIGLILFIVFFPTGVVFKIYGYVAVCCLENLIIALVILFKDSVSSALNSISQV
ncbi:hypothetical protein [Clostridium thermarum]|uniref:hypothetical protein n=1 Tax=Clostridium thermarum TaxID=1716543 RepID=UPI0013D0A60F|nr:hypothetical protein [Clostridium thermarum]